MRAAMEWAARAALVLLSSLLPGVERAEGQRAPCYQCELYKDLHPRSLPYNQIRSQCSYPCSCPARGPDCPEDVPLVRDDCGCCLVCSPHRPDPCEGGLCQETKGLPCSARNRTYHNGETFLLDCRTQCSCQNGTYACASLCPQEHISPLGSCGNPRLVDVPGQCCREWMCDSATAQQRPPDCGEDMSSWMSCSSSCGAGLSQRVSGGHTVCPVSHDSRLCQVQACQPALDETSSPTHHHVRKGHECKATQRASRPVRLRLGPCWSRKLYRPKMCGHCASSQLCCEPQVSATLRVEFLCESTAPHTLAELVRPGVELWRSSHHLPAAARVSAQFALQWVIKCRCSEECGAAGSTTAGPAPTNEDGELILHRVHRTAAP